MSQRRAEFAAYDRLPPRIRAALREGGMSAVNALALIGRGLSEDDVLEAIAEARKGESNADRDEWNEVQRASDDGEL